ncbi:MAG: hypothetical protein II388_08595 [Clostridia bacterium]|nr:hypothetical protein [Clostridia bacterium]
MSNEVMNLIETCVLVPILIAISSYIIAFFRKQTAKLQDQIKDDKAKRLIEIANEIVDQAVLSVTQTYVDGLKAEGTFDEKAQKEAFEKSKSTIYNLLTTDVINTIKDNYDSLDDWINTKIEESVGRNK